MIEYEVINRTTNEERWMCGYSFRDACERKGLEPAEWIVMSCDYID